jgi:SAM-dependent MidA family methyltransferase
VAYPNRALQGMVLACCWILPFGADDSTQPWYGQAIAQCLVSEYLLKYFPYEDFIIYEIGAGNGTLAMDILNYLREEYPDVYDRTRYNIIEISGNLVTLQKNKVRSAHPCVNVVHMSIFHWKVREPAPCFFLAMEVIVGAHCQFSCFDEN